MRCFKELVWHIRCTGEDIVRWRDTIWLTEIQLIPGRLGCKETHIIHTLSTEQWPSRTHHKDSLKNASGLHWWLWSPTLQTGSTSRDDAQKYHPNRTLACHQRNIVRSITSPYYVRSTRFMNVEGDEGVEGKSDGENTSVEPKSALHAQQPTLTVSDWRIGTDRKSGGTISTLVDEN